MGKLFLCCVTSPLLLALSACAPRPTTNTYSVELLHLGSGGGATRGHSYSALGTLQLGDGGRITGGTLTEYPGGNNAGSGSGPSCVYSVTGTYSVESTQLGTATLNLVSSPAAAYCDAADTWQLALAMASGGSVVQLVRTDDGLVSYGSAVKQ